MNYNLDFHISSMVILSILIFFYYKTPKYDSFQNKLFGAIMIVCFGTCLSDTLSAGVFMVYFSDHIWLNRISQVIYLLFQHSLAPLYYLYIVLYIKGGRWHFLSKMDKHFLTPGLLVELVNFLSLFFNIAFGYDELGYHRTGFIYIQFGVVAFYMIVCLIIVFKNSTRMSFLPRLAIFTYSVVMSVFTIIQLIYPEILLIGSAGTFTVITMYLALQNPSLLKEAMEDAEQSRVVAEEANEAKSIFLANMSHEIRTPMNAICGMADLLNKSQLNKEEKEYVNTIQSSSANLLSLINDILDFSKVDAGKMTLTVSEYRFDLMLKEVFEMVLSKKETDSVSVNYFVSPDTPMILRGDYAKTRQILLNLINNAIKFTENGQVMLYVTSTYHDEKVVLNLRVKDTGIGIKDEDKEKMFEQFAQLDMAKNRKREGTGLGLALVKSYCKLMNGRIEVDSVYGSGSTFTAIVEQEYVSLYPDAYKAQIEKILFVVLENNPYVRYSIERTLRSIHAEFTVVEEITDALFNRIEDVNFYILYNYHNYGDIIEKLNFANISKVTRVAMVDCGFKLPEQISGITYVRNPFSLCTLLDILPNDNYSMDTEHEEDELNGFSSETRIAVVDDNKVNLKVTSAILSKLGIKAKLLLSGYGILDEIDRGEEYDLIFMDHMMPDMDGVETVKRLRQMKKGNIEVVPIIALTANAVKGVEKEFMEAGMNDVLFKPVNIESLQTVLQKWLPVRLRRKEKGNENTEEKQ